MDHRQIIWLASYPKSGNTWVRCFLDAYILGELDINEILTSISDDLGHLYQIGDGSDVTKLPVQYQNLTRPMAMLRLVRQHVMTRGEEVPLFVKTHMPHVVANGIELLPEPLTKKVVYLVRDPRDVLPSFAKHMGVDLDTGLQWMEDKYRHLSSNDHRVGELISSWDNHVNTFLNADTHNVMWLRYEDMLADPVKAFSRLLEHAGITPDEERVKKALDEVDIQKLREREKKEGFRESSPHAKNQFFGSGGSSNRQKLEPKHVHRIEKAFGRVMKRLGYIDKRKAA